MDIRLLDETRTTIAILDSFISFVWTERFNGENDFELVLPASSLWRTEFVLDRFLLIQNSRVMMVIESIETTTDAEGSDVLKIAGNGLETLLKRRVLRNEVVNSGHTVRAMIKELLDQNITQMAVPVARSIPRFVMASGTGTPTLPEDARFTKGSSLYEQVLGLCTAHNLGFRIDTEDGDWWAAVLYQGVDRSESQIDRTAVIFSPSWDNFESGTYIQANDAYATVILVEGEVWDDGTATFSEVNSPSGARSGVSRFETYLDQTGLSSFVDGIGQSKSTYLKMLKAEGEKAFSEHKRVSLFEGSVRPNSQFQYGKDYGLGDIVTIKDRYGNSQDLVVSEFIRSEDRSGYYENPTFSSKDI